MICPYFGKCGGCSYQDIDYSDQVSMKEEFLKRLFGFPIDVVPSDSPFNYRNRMDFVCAFGKIGLRKKGDFRTVIDIEECLIFSRKGNELLKEIREKVIGKVDFYDFIEHKGYLRYVVIRTGEETMINFVTKTEDETIRTIAQSLELPDSIWWTVNETKSDTSYGEKVRYWKSPYITQKIKKYIFYIGPLSFFQTNNIDIEKPYSIIKEYAEGSVLDLYSGVGTIGIFVSENVDEVVCIEKDKEAVMLGNKNIKENQVENVRMQKGDIKTVFLSEFKNIDTVIVDPPRPGLGKKVVKKILLLKPRKIIYMSCNPKTQKQDIELMKEYVLEEIVGFDLFPQTPHIETVAILSKK